MATSSTGSSNRTPLRSFYSGYKEGETMRSQTLRRPASTTPSSHWPRGQSKASTLNFEFSQGDLIPPSGNSYNYQHSFPGFLEEGINGSSEEDRFSEHSHSTAVSAFTSSVTDLTYCACNH